MPLTGNIKKDIHELSEDNKKEGKEKGAHGKERSHEQIVAIAMQERAKKLIKK